MHRKKHSKHQSREPEADVLESHLGSVTGESGKNNSLMGSRGCSDMCNK